MPGPPFPSVTEDSVTWRVDDADGRLGSVRLWTDFDLGRTDFSRVEGGWELEVGRDRLPPVDRLEYLLEETGDGRTVMRTDPANPHQVGGAFGDHSVVLLGYHEPAWLRLQAEEGSRADLAVETAVGPVHVQLWSPAGRDPDEPLPLLLSHDGPEMDHLGELTRFVGVMTALHEVQGSGGIPPVRVGLLAPGPRDERYAADDAYADALCGTVVPALLAQTPTVGRPVLMGQSLGAVAALHAEWRHPGTFGGLLLQSGSFFTPDLDGHEDHHGGWGSITGFVAEVHAATRAPIALPVGVVHGSAEENAANNRLLAESLRGLGLDVAVGEVRDGHTWTCWRDLLDPWLVTILDAAGRAS
ncbi:enterochelin esterase [Microlunatus sagamiharensis]|uniref:Enterochelin esterase n=1 Tax=Microlunatus sagamiharensis TaxID=546874 RepID=A0A1H2MSY1_9ACTN|nr:alpha/beta hydrolase-fold protein [Microlunatus sagamiharensis]SDU96339.1 enterochelin esterase [Microlunatus sagamiharensis]